MVMRHGPRRRASVGGAAVVGFLGRYQGCSTYDTNKIHI